MEVRSEATLLLGPIPSERPMGPSVISRRSSLPPPLQTLVFPRLSWPVAATAATQCRWILATAAAAAVWFEVSCVSCSQSEVRGRSVGADAVYIGKIVACSCICTVGGESWGLKATDSCNRGRLDELKVSYNSWSLKWWQKKQVHVSCR